MRVLKDVFTHDELCSDSYPTKLIDDIIYEVEAKMITKSTGVDVDIGANASAEGEDAETYDSETVRVINVVDAHRLQKTVFDKKSYLPYIKAYMKRLEGYLKENKPERVEPFKAGVQTFLKGLLTKFDQFEFYTG